MFVGREKELKLLKEELKKDSSSVLIYGKRKIGKTTLIMKATEETDKPVIYYECIRDTIENNVAAILGILKERGLFPAELSLPKNDFISLTKYLDGLNRPLILIIDEYPYLKTFENPETVDSIFQSVIDNYIHHINLILSGSHIGAMKNLLEEKNALYGRFSLEISLQELNYLEASAFYKDKTPYEKVAFYGVFGGSPYVNMHLNGNESLHSNIIRLLLNPNSPVYLYASHLLISDLSNTAQVGRILSALGNGKKSYSELEQRLDKNKTGLLSKNLKPVLEAEIIRKTSPINKASEPRKAAYEISDNLLRFFYTFVLPRQSIFAMRDPDLIYEDFIEPTLVAYVSYRFEDIAKAYLWMRSNKRKESGIVDIGSYYYDDPANRRNGQFDVAILKQNGKADIYEVKYLSGPVTESIARKEIHQIRGIPELLVDRIGFISINGFEPSIEGIDVAIDGQEIYADA